MTAQLFDSSPPNVLRGPRSDRLILRKLIEKESSRSDLDEDAIAEAHTVLCKWAALEASGRLAQINETQLQGEFLLDVFSAALGYSAQTEGAETWEYEQHRTVGEVRPDGVLGRLRAKSGKVIAAIELKGPLVHLDRDRSNGRTAVQQCWDYLASIPEARWGIVSNIVSFRLYERDQTPRRYEHFALRDLTDLKEFRRFYVLLSRSGILEGRFKQEPTAARLLAQTGKRQREVGDKLYDTYSRERLELVRHIHREHGRSVEDSIGAAQTLLDRIFFIAFCEDRELLPEDTLRTAARDLPPFEKATNPRWRNFIKLFRAVDQGGHNIDAYNGGLFEESIIDQLDLDDRWTNFLESVGTYDFRDEVNLDVLGHLFEKSITELEKLREGDLFASNGDAEAFARMPKSAKRKRFGIYYTPPEFTAKITELTIDSVIAERFRAHAEQRGVDAEKAGDLEYWRDCFETLKSLKVVDPACGSGAFLFQAYELLESRYGSVIDRLAELGDPNAESLSDQIPEFILHENLYGVDLSEEAVEITRLALWIRSARRGRTLEDLSHNIRCGNSLVDDPGVHQRAFDWREEYQEVFDRAQAGFDCVIGNPPWERMKVQEREFFALSAPEIATSTNAAKRRKLIAKLENENPELYERYLTAKSEADAQLTYARTSGRFPLTGKGDINTYAVFAELASQIVAPTGRVGLLVPSGIATDKTTKDFFASIAESDRLGALYDFENKRPYFPDVHRSFKFCVLRFDGASGEGKNAEYVFFARDIDEIANSRRRIQLSGKDIALLNPNTRTCPIFRSARDARLTKSIYERVPVLIRREGKRTVNEWGISFMRMFDQTNDAELFVSPEELQKRRFRAEGNRFVKGKHVYLSLYEAKMIQAFDHRAASVEIDPTNWVRQGKTFKTTYAQHGDPGHVVSPRWWVSGRDVGDSLGEELPPACLGFKDITSPTNQRTMIASFVPASGFTNHFVLIQSPSEMARQACLLANLNAFVFDYVTRQKIGGVTLNFFIVEQLPTLPPHTYDLVCPWERASTLLHWMSERVLKLSCTAADMIPLAEAAEFDTGDSHDGRVNRWKAQERADLMAELDAAFFILYGIEPEDAEYILSTFKIAQEPTEGLPSTKTPAENILESMEDLLSRSR